MTDDTKTRKPRKRDNGEGTVSQRKDGVWQTAVMIDGKRTWAYGPTREDVVAKNKQLQKLRDDHKKPPNKSMTLATFLESWLEAVQPRYTPSSFKNARWAVNSHIVPHFKTAKLASIRPLDIDQFYGKLSRTKSEQFGRPLSGTTVRHIHEILHVALEYAVNPARLIPINPAGDVKPPRSTVKEMQTLTPEQTRAVLGELQDHPLYALFVLAFATGMRISELFALSKHEILVKSDEVRCWFNLSRVDGEVIRKETKRRRQRRVIAVSPEAMAVVRRHIAQQAERRLALGPAWDDTFDLLFSQPNGMPLHNRTVNQILEDACKRASVPVIAPHEMRHTSASILLQIFPVSVVSERLGHADAATTLRVYGHLMPGNLRAAGDALGGLIPSQTG